MKTRGALKRCALLTAFALAFSALSDLIYWQIDGTKNGYEFTYAQFVQIKSGETKETVLTLVDSTGAPAGDLVFADDMGKGTGTGTGTGGAVWAQGTFGEGDKFYLELFDDSGEQVAWTAAVNYSSITQFIAKDITSQIVTAWTPNVVPEPSSGLLVLMGGALLALRRRRRA